MTRPSDAPDPRRQDLLVQDVARGVQRMMLDAVLQLGGRRTDPAAMTVPRAREPRAPAWLAGHHPGGPQMQAQVRALYERCLAHYRESVCPAPPGAACDDVGAVLARFVAANLAALHDIDVTPSMLASLERQLGGVLQVSPAWMRADLRERQSYVEQLAIIAVLVRETSAQAVLEGAAAVANVQRAARGYVLQLLGLEADRITITEDGLAYADAATTV